MALGGMSRPFRNPKEKKNGFAVTTASAQEAPICQVDPSACDGQYEFIAELAP
jgi:hypothetical protein